MSQYSDNALAKDDENTAWMQVLNLIGDDWKILDIGCSSGNLGEELIKTKNSVVDGIELDERDAKIAKKKLRHVEQFNIENHENIEGVFNEKYDAILLIDVIEHLVNPVAALKKIQQLLKPGGKIIFSIPNMAHVSVRLALLSGDFTYTKTGLLDKTHLHFYTGKEVSRIFKEAGYKITEFNSSSLQYPLELHTEKLFKLGLNIKDTEKYTTMLKESNGNVYQYVGTAQYTGGKDTKQPPIPVANAHEKDYKEIEKMLDGNKQHIDFLEKSVKLKDDHISNLENIIQEQKERTISRRLKRKIHPKRD